VWCSGKSSRFDIRWAWLWDPDLPFINVCVWTNYSIPLRLNLLVSNIGTIIFISYFYFMRLTVDKVFRVFMMTQILMKQNILMCCQAADACNPSTQADWEDYQKFVYKKHWVTTQSTDSWFANVRFAWGQPRQKVRSPCQPVAGYGGTCLSSRSLGSVSRRIKVQGGLSTSGRPYPKNN
jgi:hypothetical protein